MGSLVSDKGADDGAVLLNIARGMGALVGPAVGCFVGKTDGDADGETVEGAKVGKVLG